MEAKKILLADDSANDVELTAPWLSTTSAIGLRLLLLEDSANDAELEVALLEDAGYACRWERVQTREDFLARLDAEPYDCILSDYRLPAFNGLAALRMVRDKGLIVPFILVSGTLGEEEAIDSLKAGATDYVLKTRLQRLVPAVQRALAERAEARRYCETEAARVEEAEISTALVRVAHEVIASLDTPVLLRQLCQLTTELLQCNCSHAYLLRPDGNVDVVMAGHGQDNDGGDARRVERSAAGGLAQLLGRLENDAVVELPADAAPLVLLPAQLECTRSGVGLYVALRRGAGIVGVLAASRRRAEPFARTHRRVAHGIAQLASLALANARVVQELEEVSRLKSDFVSVMSHELRTPLHIIMGYGDLLGDGALGPLNPEQLNAVQRSGRAARELLELVNTILDVGQLEAGALCVDSDTDLPELFAQIDTETEAARGDKPDLRVQLVVAPGARRLRIDRAKLKVIIKKVIENAIKFTDTGTVTVDAQPHDGGIEITVTDTGIGIIPEVLPVIFQPFRQSESAMTRRHGGVGLGLYAARRLLDTLGGRITVASTPGQGSTFRIWVPSSGGLPAERVQGAAA